MTRAPKAIGCYIGCIEPSVPEAMEQPFATPADVKMSAGEGASVDDLKRGFKDPDISEKPEYDLDNYKDRFTQKPARDFQEDYAFRNKDRTTRGLLTRSRYSDD